MWLGGTQLLVAEPKLAFGTVLPPSSRVAAIDSNVPASWLSLDLPTATPNFDVSPSAVPAAEQQQAPQDRVALSALFVAVDPITAGSNGQEDGVMVVRATTSSRGGERAPVPTPVASPTPTASPTPVASPSPTPTSVPRSGPLKTTTYKVQAGDTLLGIADKFGITPETILWANNLGNGDLIQIGAELTILPVSGVLHTVQKGDTLLSIAQSYGADSSKIAEANGLRDANSLQEGQQLIVPGGMMRTTEAITGPPTAPSPQQLVNAPKYVVKDGDTLVSIADAFGVKVSAIQAANNLLDPNMLKVGLELTIPGGTAPAATASAPTPKPAVAAAPTATPTAKPAPTSTPRPVPTPTPKPAAKPAAATAQAMPPAPAGDIGNRIAAIAQKYLGYRYVWGGSSPSGFDCSGFTWYVYQQVGIHIPNHDLWGQLNAGPRISRDQLQPGDLVFFQNTYMPGLSHSGIYLGGGRFINAETESVGVQIRSLSDPYWSPRFVGGSRPR